MFYQLKFFDPSASTATISMQAGIIFSAKTAAQVITGMFWGRLADSDWGGRKLVLTVGLLSCCMSTSIRVSFQYLLTNDRYLSYWIWIL